MIAPKPYEFILVIWDLKVYIEENTAEVPLC